MSFPQFRSCVCILLTMTSLTISSLAQNGADAPHHEAHRKIIAPSQFEVYAGYGLFHPVDSGIGAYTYATVENKNTQASFAGFWNHHWGFQAEGGYFSGTSVRGVLGQCTPSCASRDQNIYTAEVGPIYRFHLPAGFVPFVHVLGGGAKINGPALQSLSWGYAMSAGGGVDYVLPILHNHLALRPAQLDFQYSHVNYGPLTQNGLMGGIGELKAYRLTSGIVLRLGNTPDARQTLALSCAVNADSVEAGEPVRVITTATGLNVRRYPTYSYTTSGGTVSANGGAAEIDTTGLKPGSYAVEGRLRQGTKPWERASCATSFAVTAPVMPAAPMEAAPVAVPDAVVAIPETPPVPAAVPPPAQAQALCSVSFERDRRRTTRVDNEAKGCLDEVALELRRSADSTLLVTGTFSPGEAATAGMARANHVKEYLTGESGVEARRIRVRSNRGEKRSAENLLVPAGADDSQK